MIVLIQRVRESSVAIDEKVVCEIKKGILVFLGVGADDAECDCEYLASKIPELRIFEDKEGKMNLSCRQIKGEVLVVSQFTLLADTRKGNRPSFTQAAKSENALKLYKHFVRLLKNSGLNIKTGEFAQDMQIRLVNDGPVTIILDSKEKR